MVRLLNTVFAALLLAVLSFAKINPEYPPYFTSPTKESVWHIGDPVEVEWNNVLYETGTVNVTFQPAPNTALEFLVPKRVVAVNAPAANSCGGECGRVSFVIDNLNKDQDLGSYQIVLTLNDDGTEIPSDIFQVTAWP
ncbi:uncharacterized protein UTRI_10121 [Ustilago trichophora]|uniref:Uncharacterized protein n=1 Tax=Ustilago trichophora TaxID=86804 RepID=A0A5C3DZI3_9BASI|nr:uncharacterized protein UTRI_10121 [Ustilago trichophora]